MPYVVPAGTLPIAQPAPSSDFYRPQPLSATPTIPATPLPPLAPAATANLSREPVDFLSDEPQAVVLANHPGDGLAHALPSKPLVNADTTDPFTAGLARYTGYFNEMTAACNNMLQMVLDRLFGSRAAGAATQLDHFADSVVLGYCAVDAAYSGTKEYFHTKETTGRDDLAQLRGIQKGVSQGIFQGLASFYVPAEIIRKVIRPAGEMIGGAVVKGVLLNDDVQPNPSTGLKAKLLPFTEFESTVSVELAEKLKEISKDQSPILSAIEEKSNQLINGEQRVKIVQKFTQVPKNAVEELKKLPQFLDGPLAKELEELALKEGAFKPVFKPTGMLLALASIPLLVKIIDPLSEWLVKNVWEKPMDRYIDHYLEKHPEAPALKPPSAEKA
jgi:hypothetical protein